MVSFLVEDGFVDGLVPVVGRSPSMKAVFLAAALVGSWFPMATVAQAQIQVCGPPPLPPCEERVPRELEPRERVPREGYSRPPGERRVGEICRTPELRCRLDEPRPIGAGCTCFDEDGEPEDGRVVR